MKKRALIIFTRVPVPGQTKTRLMPYFTPRQCARLHRCFLEDLAKVCSKAGADVFVCWTAQEEEEGAESILREIFGGSAVYFRQSGDDLGERMYRAIEEVLGKGCEACVLMGTDVPEVQDGNIRLAFEILEKKDVVFGPTADGGYYLTGMKKPRREVFENQTYGHGSVLENTIRGLERAKLTVGLGAMQHDIDTEDDIQSLRDRLRTNRRFQRTETGKYLMKTGKISVIVPIYNEEKTIRAILGDLRRIKDRCEIILVDGGSTDRTLEYIDSDFRLLHSEKGRAKQMNLGAKESSGDILFFLHCDSELPEKPLEQIRYVMKDYRVGCFGIAFHSVNFFMFTCRVISNHRIKDRNVVFGDQGIGTELFFEKG